TEIIAQMCTSDARFSELRLSHNVGVARALALGVRMARTGLIARMDADDICHPDRLRRQVLFLQRHPRVAVVGSAVSVIDSHYQYPPQHPGGLGEGQGGAEADKGDGYKIIEQPTLAGHVRWRLLFHCCVAHPSVMMRRDSLLRCGGYLRPDQRTHIGHITVEHVEDYHLWMRIVGLLPSPAASTSAPAAAANSAPFDLARVARSNTDTPRPHTAGPNGTNADGFGRSDRHAAEDGHEICNLGDVLLLLRKHPQNISGLQADEQASKALTLRQLALARLLPPVSASGMASSALLSAPSVQVTPTHRASQRERASARAKHEHKRPRAMHEQDEPDLFLFCPEPLLTKLELGRRRWVAPKRQRRARRCGMPSFCCQMYLPCRIRSRGKALLSPPGEVDAEGSRRAITPKHAMENLLAWTWPDVLWI
ncbi:MAG: glycosyltransferase, partial [Promethearchaeia archaeon]